MAKIIDDSWTKAVVISTIFSSAIGSLLILIYLYWGKIDSIERDITSFLFSYILVTSVSVTGTLVGSLVVGVPVAMLSRRLHPAASFKGSLLIVGTALFIWLAVLAWPVRGLFEIHYSDILLLTPYTFCSAVAFAYMVYWNKCI
ncbi:hypothetical protein SJI00_03585 [Pseudomonas sp. RP23018S]|uniref:hypothetical protein n=1 Tax=Pseudomonas sp. RP23018S TaxID=3096037 RepID=UPI002ACABEEF|nr:hypothetical protein [Pseudomonas sp. RP23018S]MDZ5601859.1 hypothetical protein [Pseudomonas sp. RP23018S]